MYLTGIYDERILRMASLFNGRKKKSIVKKGIATAAPTVLLVVLIVGAATAVVGAIAGVLLAIFGPLIQTEKYRNDAVYNAVANYGGAYKALELGVLTDDGLNSEVIKDLFEIEYYSFDSISSEFTIPKISSEKYNQWSDSNDKSEDDGNGGATREVLWDMNSFTYQYRTHWQYLLALASIKKLDDDGAVDDIMNSVADKIDADGNVTDTTGLIVPVTVEDLSNVEASLREHNLWTDIKYYTNYTSDNLKEQADDDSDGKIYCGDLSQEQICSGYSFVNYNYNLFHTNINRGDYFDERGIAGSTRYSTLDKWNGVYNIGNEAGEYAYITSKSELFPCMLIKEASNWLCKYYDYDYVKINDDGDTHYVLTSYTKEYRIGELIQQWKDFGIEKEMSELISLVLNKVEDSIGGTIATEFDKAYEYYNKYGTEMKVVYTHPYYSPIDTSNTVSMETTYGKELNVVTTDSSSLEDRLKELYRDGNEFEPDVTVGQKVAQAFYECGLRYQTHFEDGADADSGYHIANYSNAPWQPSPTWGEKAYDQSTAGTEGNDINERVGLSSAGFINYILRYSLFGSDYSCTNSQYLGYRPTISQIYRTADYKFRTISELQPGDIAVLNPDNDDENENVIAYYVGQEGDNHIFYSLSPTGSFGSNGGVRKLCLSGEPGDIDTMAMDLTYFCRYYYGKGNDTIKQYRSGSKAKYYKAYKAVVEAYGNFIGDMPSGYDNINHQDELVDYIINNASDLGMESYTDRELLLHLSSGIMGGGVGDDRDVGFTGGSSDDLYTRLYDNDLLAFPVDYDSYKYISSWWSWRDLDGSGYGDDSDGFEDWHDGLDIAAPRGTPIMACADGTVIVAVDGYAGGVGESFGTGGGYGNHVTIDHGDGIITTYGHMVNLADGIDVGTEVTQGQVIGYVGSSGSSYGYHVHLKVEDGQVHDSEDGLGFPERGGRPAGRETSVDPYQFFPELAGSGKVASDITGDRPKWFDADQ